MAGVGEAHLAGCRVHHARERGDEQHGVVALAQLTVGQGERRAEIVGFQQVLAQQALRAHHEQRRGNALARHVADDEGHAALAHLEHVVEVAAHLTCRAHEAGDIEREAFRERIEVVRHGAHLDLPGHVELGGRALALGRDVVQALDEADHVATHLVGGLVQLGDLVAGLRAALIDRDAHVAPALLDVGFHALDEGLLVEGEHFDGAREAALQDVQEREHGQEDGHHEDGGLVEHGVHNGLEALLVAGGEGDDQDRNEKHQQRRRDNEPDDETLREVRLLDVAVRDVDPTRRVGHKRAALERVKQGQADVEQHPHVIQAARGERRARLGRRADEQIDGKVHTRAVHQDKSHVQRRLRRRIESRVRARAFRVHKVPHPARQAVVHDLYQEVARQHERRSAFVQDIRDQVGRRATENARQAEEQPKHRPQRRRRADLHDIVELRNRQKAFKDRQVHDEAGGEHAQRPLPAKPQWRLRGFWRNGSYRHPPDIANSGCGHLIMFRSIRFHGVAPPASVR